MSAPDRKILIVEDEAKIADVISDYLCLAGFKTERLADGLAVVDWVKANPVNLILLDLMLPGKDGIDVCRDIRQFSDVPIIMVTARVEELDRLLGLELGADDYICKPFSPREVVARVKTVLRRIQSVTRSKEKDCMTLLNDSHRIQFSGREVQLTTVEYQLMKTLSDVPGRILSRSQLIDHIYDDYRIVSDRTVDSHIKKLRKKLSELDLDPELIQSVYGAGYRYEPQDNNR